MKGAVLYGPRDVRFEEREAPKIEKPMPSSASRARSCSTRMSIFTAVQRRCAASCLS